MELAETGAVTIYREICELLLSLPRLNGAKLFALAEKVARSGLGSFVTLLSQIEERAMRGAYAAVTPVPGEEMLLRHLRAAVPLEAWSVLWDDLRLQAGQADELNLDKKQLVLNTFFASRRRRGDSSSKRLIRGAAPTYLTHCCSWIRPMLVDSHCHLDFPDFGPELDDVVVRARAAGVGTMLTIGTKLKSFDRVRAIAERFEDVWCSVGVHPHEAAEEPVEEASALISHAAHPRVVGIGEAGLDYYYEHSPKTAQVRNFRAHIAAARETGLPLIVHARDADADLCAIMTEESGRGAFPGLIHCFSSTAKLVRTAWSSA